MSQVMRRAYYAFQDNLERLLGKRDPSTPPRHLIEGIGGGDFRAIGEEFFRYFREFGELKPRSRVLDVGCGCGRMGVPLTKYLSAEGEYWGFDIVEAGIAWCQKNIAAKHPNFHFLLADVYNSVYHKKGRYKAAEYRFPLQDDYFDLVALTSVFTHMLAPDMGNYLEEISRVLKPKGRCLITYFLLNEEAQRLLGQGLGTVKFPFAGQDCMISQQKRPEAAVGFEEGFIRRNFARQGLEIVEPIHYGSWCGRKQPLSYQDIVVGVKKVEGHGV